jgi:DNA polymerase-3 subunit gamma/tau
LLERLRDLIVVLAVGEKADSVLRGVPKDQIEKLTTQAFGFGMASLTHASEVVSETLNSMSGATSPKLQLELMCAKVLVPAAGDTEAGSLARLDRLERRVGMSGSSTAAGPAAAPAQVTSPAAAAPATEPVAIAQLSTEDFKAAWAEILAKVNKASKSAWMLAFALQVVDFDAAGVVLTLKFSSARDLEAFKGEGTATDVLRKAIDEVLGVTVMFKAQFSEPETAPIAVVTEAVTKAEGSVADEADEDVSLLEEEADAAEPAPAPVVEKAKPKSRNSKLVDEDSRYGESLLREMLGAEPIEDKKNTR